jgi:hypothetical protein
MCTYASMYAHARLHAHKFIPIQEFNTFIHSVKTCTHAFESAATSSFPWPFPLQKNIQFPKLKASGFVDTRTVQYNTLYNANIHVNSHREHIQMKYWYKRGTSTRTNRPAASSLASSSSKAFCCSRALLISSWRLILLQNQTERSGSQCFGDDSHCLSVCLHLPSKFYKSRGRWLIIICMSMFLTIACVSILHANDRNSVHITVWVTCPRWRSPSLLNMLFPANWSCTILAVPHYTCGPALYLWSCTILAVLHYTCGPALYLWSCTILVVLHYTCGPALYLFKGPSVWINHL